VKAVAFYWQARRGWTDKDEITLAVSQAEKRYRITVHMGGISRVHCFCTTRDDALSVAKGQQIRDEIRASVGECAGPFKVRYQTNERTE
jgi:hypothetical protein